MTRGSRLGASVVVAPDMPPVLSSKVAIEHKSFLALRFIMVRGGSSNGSNTRSLGVEAPA